MILEIDYHAAYTYDECVSLSPHIVRIFPRRDMLTRVVQQSFHCGGGANVQFQRDLHDNETAFCFFPTDTHHFEITLQTTLEVTPRNPLEFLLDTHGLTLPPIYTNAEIALLMPHLSTCFADPLPPPLAPGPPRPTVETIMNMMHWMHREITYERREEGDPLPPAQLLTERVGTCRDFMTLMVEALRQNGVAARLVSGYLWEEPDHTRRVADHSLHAWVEAYLPGAGWLALDPTNGVFCDHHAIPTAAGLTPEEIAPVSGTYYGERQIPSHLTTRLTIQPPAPA
jgi:transglutaminase-like putative cysteine protease